MDFAKQDGTTSVKVHHAPGGKSNFSLAWDTQPNQPKTKTQQPTQIKPTQVQQPVVQGKSNNVQTSVKVHNPPGGKSSFTLG